MNKRQRMIALSLLKQTDYVTSNFLANQNGVSTKTILKDISNIEEFFASENITIVKKPRYGIKCQCSQKDKIRMISQLKNRGDFNQNDFDERMLYYIRTLFLENKELDVPLIEDTFFLSNSSVRRDIDKLQSILDKYKVTLIKRANKVTVSISEYDKRKILRNIAMDCYENQGVFSNEIKELLHFDDLTYLKSIIRKKVSDYQYILPIQYEVYLLLDLLILKNKINLGFSTDVSKGELDDLKNNHLVYLLASDIVSEYLKKDIEFLSTNDVLFISRTLLSVGYLKNQSRTSNFQLIDLFIDRVSQLSEIDFTEDLDLRRMLSSHFGPMINRLRNDIIVKNQTTEDIKSRYGILYNIVWLASQVIRDSIGVEINEGELAFLTLYFVVSVEKKHTPVHFYIICPHGIATSQLIVSSIQDLVSEIDTIETVDKETVLTKTFNSSDIIISSIFLGDLKSDYFLVSPILTKDDLNQISNKYREISKKTAHSILLDYSKVTTKSRLLKELVTNKIFVDCRLKNLEDCISFINTKSSNDNSSNRDFKDSIIKREQLGYTSLYTGVALPHADPKAVKKSEIIIMQLHKPIEWGKNFVQLIVFIALRDNEISLYKQTLVEIFQKINSKHFIASLVDKKSPESIMALLLN